MKIKVNNEPREVEPGLTVAALVEMLCDHKGGVAVAVNSSLVRRPQWSEKVLEENDDVVIINAAYGG